ncbi:uncharacterized protein LOC128546452 [Mercenaria mercenaria]|uniref:uncharacterized protein LOC128546452 n=1 Tax=Mercenaria mercenaria TaxID=6596 RepID=UPI00234FAA55|nr:uncharacterized protein LOC128546452 [Mercenaria mercenaria]
MMDIGQAKIYTSKPDQQKIIVEPTLKANDDHNEIKLAYISIPDILKHYDACISLAHGDSEQFVATPLPSASTDIPDSSVSSASVHQTPKKAAKFVSPMKKKLFRKRKSTPENWKKNVRKRLRLSGEEYISSSGKKISRKLVQECDCTKCKYKCNDKVSFEKRCAIRDFYNGLASYERQKDFICSNVHEKNTKTYLDDDGNKVEKKKQVMRIYSMEVNNHRVRVCKKFFLKTLSISEATVAHALTKKMSGYKEGTSVEDKELRIKLYENAKTDGTLDEKLEEEYKLHQERKKVAREQKQKDNHIARQDSKVKTCTFDLQSVLYTPCSLVSLMYYMRKLCCYNLSIYSAGDKKATCYLWSETDGKRGSNEISTCLNLYLSRLESPVEHVILYSDACAGQNKNQIVATCLLNSVTTIPGLKITDHKFLESGHTHMECDSMHSAIEFAKSKTKTFVPGQWETVISMARRKSPYNVVSLKFYDFKNFKSARTKANSKTESGKKPR